jgi:hypothetical protein
MIPLIDFSHLSQRFRRLAEVSRLFDVFRSAASSSSVECRLGCDQPSIVTGVANGQTTGSVNLNVGVSNVGKSTIDLVRLGKTLLLLFKRQELLVISRP